MSEYRGEAFPAASAGARGGGDAPASEAALRALREQRAEIARGIGEHLYRLIMGGLVRDPAVVAACRPLYEMEQQILRMEATLGTSGASAGAQSAPPTVAAPPPLPLPVRDRDEMSTAISPGQRPAWQSNPPAAAGSRPGSIAHDHHAPHGAPAADRACAHCRMPLKTTDRTCPVCGRDTTDAVPLASASASAPGAVPAPAPRAVAAPAQCPRCGTALRAQDHTCPVCGTAQTR